MQAHASRSEDGEVPRSQGKLKQRPSPLSAQRTAGDFPQFRRDSQQLLIQKELSQLNSDSCPAIPTTLPSPSVTGPQPFVSKSKAHLYLLWNPVFLSISWHQHLPYLTSYVLTICLFIHPLFLLSSLPISGSLLGATLSSAPIEILNSYPLSQPEMLPPASKSCGPIVCSTDSTVILLPILCPFHHHR